MMQVLSVAFLAVAAAVDDARVTLEARRAPPAAWARGARVNPKDLVELTFLLKTPEESFAQMDRELAKRSNPASPNYAQWLSNDQVHALAAPADDGAVAQFLAAQGVGAPTARTPNGDALSLTVTYAAAEALLGTEYYTYSHVEQSNIQIARCAAYSLPAEVAPHVALVGPTTRFPALRTPKNMVSSEATYSNDPDNLRSLYGVGSAVGGLAKQSVTAFIGQYYRSNDLKHFLATYLPIASDTAIDLVGDATDGTPAGVEAMLDIEYMPALGSLNPTGFWGFSGTSPENAADEPFLTWLITVGNTSDADVPLLFSTSYGEDEADEVPSAYADRINTEFVKCGLRGISLLFASGDSGAASDTGTCPNGVFLPKWPADSPYVTGVGGATNGELPELAWEGSSGGFSNQFAQPSWQVDSVATFMATAGAAGSLPNASFFNATGRGFPDISAQSVNFPVIADGQTLPTVGGTSCAAPTAGGIFGLLNHARLAANKTSLGFLNPLLYANPGALNDVSLGVQGGCRIDSQEVAGFPAVLGWDPVTGLGSPNYPDLLEIVMALA